MKDYKSIFEQMIVGTQKYLEDNNLWSMILGISGGLDSTVTAAICHEVEKRNPELKFYGISLPCTSNTIDENNSANACMKAFCKEGQYWTENLQKEYMLMKATCCQRHSPTTIGQGNIKARLRMIYLYDLANYTKGLVMDTDNLTEHYLGFFTIHGDVCDLNPIGGLWKHEVYELAQYIRDYYQNESGVLNTNKVQALNEALGIRPTDGNGVNDLGDMGQIAPAFAHEKNIDAYTKVDDIIQTYLNICTLSEDLQKKHLDRLHEKYPNIEDNGCVIHDTIDEVIGRVKRTEYKRKGLPIVIPREKYFL